MADIYRDFGGKQSGSSSSASGVAWDWGPERPHQFSVFGWMFGDEKCLLVFGLLFLCLSFFFIK